MLSSSISKELSIFSQPEEGKTRGCEEAREAFAMPRGLEPKQKPATVELESSENRNASNDV